MSTINVNIRVDEEIERQAEKLFSEFGFDMTTAVNVFLRQSIREQAIPFSIDLPPRGNEMDDETFFSGANLEHIKKSVAHAEAGKIARHELITADE